MFTKQKVDETESWIGMLSVLLTTALLAACAEHTGAASKPNFILLMADDMARVLAVGICNFQITNVQSFRWILYEYMYMYMYMYMYIHIFYIGVKI